MSINLLDLEPPKVEKKPLGVFAFDLLTPKSVFSDDVDETTRIINLPETYGYDIDLSWIYRENPTITLRDIQYKALQAISATKGLLGLIPVGHGKTLIAYLASVVLDSEKTVILMPPNMVQSFTKELEKYIYSFKLPKSWKILPYSILSSPKQSDILYKINPDLIVADEAHSLAAKNSSRAIRFRTYMREHPETRFVAMSATFLKRSIADLAPLSYYALRHLSPFPNDERHASLWTECLDVNGKAAITQWDYFNKFTKAQGIDISNLIGEERQEKAREAVYLRLAKTAGVVITDQASCDKPLSIECINIEVPECITAALSTIEEGETPNHEDIVVDDIHKARITKNVSCGFYYRWAWEEIGGRDEDWLLRRKIWNRELRRELMYHNYTHYDSPLLITNTVSRDPEHPLHSTYQQWACVKHKPIPPTVPVWLDDFLIRDLLDRLNSVPTIVWYESAAVATALEKIMPVYGAGTLPPTTPITCALSINVHGTGKNLQHWWRNIILEPPTSATKWEQLLGRTHRPGQENAVEVLVYTHTKYLALAIEKAKEQAEFVYSLQRSPQKLLTATWR